MSGNSWEKRRESAMARELAAEKDRTAEHRIHRQNLVIVRNCRLCSAEANGLPSTTLRPRTRNPHPHPDGVL